MTLRDAIDVAAEIESDVGKVQVLICREQSIHLLEVRPLKHMADVIEGKMVVAGRNRCVRGEDALRADGFEVLDKTVAPVLARLFIKQFDGKERRVALIHVKASDTIKAESAKDAHSADAKNDFLAEAIMLVTAI
jgi:hypothetical protein